MIPLSQDDPLAKVILTFDAPAHNVPPRVVLTLEFVMVNTLLSPRPITVVDAHDTKLVLFRNWSVPPLLMVMVLPQLFEADTKLSVLPLPTATAPPTVLTLV